MEGSSLYYEQFVVGAPSIIGGVKYNFLNKNHKESAAIIISANYGLVRYLKYRINYKIDGEVQNDYLSEKGINIQFGLSFPIVRFKAKNK